MRIAGACLISAMAVLAACSKPPAPKAPPSAPAAATPTGASIGRPLRKPGLWLMTISTDSGPGITLNGEMCLDAETEKTTGFAPAGVGQQNCGKPVFHPAAGGLTFDTICKFGGRRVITHGVTSGDFDSAYDMLLTARTEPPLPVGKGAVTTHIKAKWAGPCRPGQEPGHVSMKVGGFGQG